MKQFWKVIRCIVWLVGMICYFSELFKGFRQLREIEQSTERAKKGIENARIQIENWSR